MAGTCQASITLTTYAVGDCVRSNISPYTIFKITNIISGNYEYVVWSGTAWGDTHYYKSITDSSISSTTKYTCP